MARLILASGSPRRRELLKLLNIPFDIIHSGIDEQFDPSASPSDVVLELSMMKAEAVADDPELDDVLVIGADTIVVTSDHRILGQPEGHREAFSMLRSLSGTSHRVLTGISLIRNLPSGESRQIRFHEVTRVMFGELSDEEIDRYIQSGSPLDKAGGYGIQDDWGALFVSGIEGDYCNVVGFPLHRLYHTLKEFAPEILKLRGRSHVEAG